jgi:hypothetical protein
LTEDTNVPPDYNNDLLPYVVSKLIVHVNIQTLFEKFLSHIAVSPKWGVSTPRGARDVPRGCGNTFINIYIDYDGVRLRLRTAATNGPIVYLSVDM